MGTYLWEGKYARTLRISPQGSPLLSRDPRPQPSGPPWGAGEWVPAPIALNVVPHRLRPTRGNLQEFGIHFHGLGVEVPVPWEERANTEAMASQAVRPKSSQWIDGDGRDPGRI